MTGEFRRAVTQAAGTLLERNRRRTQPRVFVASLFAVAAIIAGGTVVGSVTGLGTSPGIVLVTMVFGIVVGTFIVLRARR